jgi:hypothetical protein
VGVQAKAAVRMSRKEQLKREREEARQKLDEEARRQAVRGAVVPPRHGPCSWCYGSSSWPPAQVEEERKRREKLEAERRRKEELREARRAREERRGTLFAAAYGGDWAAVEVRAAHPTPPHLLIKLQRFYHA